MLSFVNQMIINGLCAKRERNAIDYRWMGTLLGTNARDIHQRLPLLSTFEEHVMRPHLND